MTPPTAALPIADCPFCGEKPALYQGTWEVGGRYSWILECVPCMFQLQYGKKKECIDAWNRRAPAVQATADADGAAREILKFETEYDSLVFTDEQWVEQVAAIIRKAVSPKAAAEGPEWVDTMLVKFDDTLLMGQNYDWFGWENLRTELHTPHGSFAVWPNRVVDKTYWSFYCTNGGIIGFERYSSKEQAKEEAETVLRSLASVASPPAAHNLAQPTPDEPEVVKMLSTVIEGWKKCAAQWDDEGDSPRASDYLDCADELEEFLKWYRKPDGHFPKFAAAQEQKPVAWAYAPVVLFGKDHSEEDFVVGDDRPAGEDWVPLFASPIPYTQADYDRNAIKVPADVRVTAPSIGEPASGWVNPREAKPIPEEHPDGVLVYYLDSKGKGWYGCWTPHAFYSSIPHDDAVGWRRMPAAPAVAPGETK